MEINKNYINQFFNVNIYMDYKNKYLKYKKKYTDLKNRSNQTGGVKIIVNRDDSSQRISIKDRFISTNIELLVNQIPIEILENRKELGEFFFDFYSEPNIKDLNNNDFKIIDIIFKKITRVATQEELDFLDNILGVTAKPVAEAVVEVAEVAETEKVNDEPIMHYTYINPIPDSMRVPDLNILFSLFFSIDDQTFNDLNYIAYFFNTRELITKRLSFLKSYGIPNPINIFNKEKKMTVDTFIEINKIYPSFETIFIKDLKIDYSKSDGHKNTGIIILDKPYFYKELDFFTLKTMDIFKIFKHYKFILDCNNMNIDTDYGNYKLHFVTVPLKIIFSIRNDQFIIGYLMEVVEGYTVRQIKRKFIEYWTKNSEIIKTALHTLVEKLTEKQFLIVDFNDDNVMWNIETNTLTYIDISQRSFIRQDEVHENASVHRAIEVL